MKSRIAVAAAVAALIPSIAFAQAGSTPPKKEMDHQGGHHSSSGWKELDTFHNLLAATWHPLESGAGDFKPVRENAVKLADAAKAWSEAKAPAGCDSKEIKDGIAAAAKKARDVSDLVAKKAPDADVKVAMKALHDGFEHVEHGCKPKS